MRRRPRGRAEAAREVELRQTRRRGELVEGELPVQVALDVVTHQVLLAERQALRTVRLAEHHVGVIAQDRHRQLRGERVHQQLAADPAVRGLRGDQHGYAVDGRVVRLDRVVQGDVGDLAVEHRPARGRELLVGEVHVHDLDRVRPGPVRVGGPGEERDVARAEPFVVPARVELTAHVGHATPVGDEVPHRRHLDVGVAVAVAADRDPVPGAAHRDLAGDPRRELVGNDEPVTHGVTPSTSTAPPR